MGLTNDSGVCRVSNIEVVSHPDRRTTTGDRQMAVTEAVETEATEAEAQDEGTKRTHAKTTYAGKGFDLAAVDELPDSAPAGRSRIYFEILEAVANDTDNLAKWHPIARFGTDNGASSVKNQLTKQVTGKVLNEDQAKVPAKDRDPSTRGFITPDQVRDIPEYEGWHFEFESRKVPAESGKIGARDSILYARLVQNEG